MPTIEGEDKPSILDSVRAVADEMEKPPVAREDGPEPADLTPPAETAQQRADRARDEGGRFAKETKPRETLSLKKSPETAEKPADVSASAAPPAAAGSPGAPDPLAPPAEWKGAGKVQWGKLPAPVQAQIHEDYKALAAAREQFAPLEQAIAPHRDVLTRAAGSVESGINQLMQFYNLFLTNPVGLIQHIAATRGINLGQPAGQEPQPGATQQQAPDFASLIEQAVQQRVAPIERHLSQAAIQPGIDLLTSAKTDPKYPFFNDIFNSLEHFIALEKDQLSSEGKTASPAAILDGAYQRAIWSHPVIRPQLEQQKAEAAKATQAAAVAKARAASAVNLNGSPLAGVVAGGRTKGESVLDSVRRAAAEAEGA